MDYIEKYKNDYKYAIEDDKRVVLLQSGGLDSCIVATLLKKVGFSIHHVFVDYGQNMYDKEREVSEEIYKKLYTEGDTYQEVKLDLPWLKTSCNLVDNTVNDYNAEGTFNSIEYNTYVPMRNIMLLSIASSYAEANEICNIACAFDGAETKYGQPLGGTTDKHPTFVNSVANALTEGSALFHIKDKHFNILTPVMGMFKDEIIKLGTTIDAPLECSWSCYNKGEKPCGCCSACKVRAQGFQALGISDPLLKG